MPEPTPHPSTPLRTFYVIHYVDQWPLGRVSKVLASDMTFNEALAFAQNEIEEIPSQALTILDDANPGWEYEVKPMQLEP